MACNNINFKEIKEGYKETIRLFCRQLMGEDDDFKKKFKEFAHRKYVMESISRPLFGDSDEIYEYWLDCVDGACIL